MGNNIARKKNPTKTTTKLNVRSKSMWKNVINQQKETPQQFHKMAACHQGIILAI